MHRADGSTQPLIRVSNYLVRNKVMILSMRKPYKMQSIANVINRLIPFLDTPDFSMITTAGIVNSLRMVVANQLAK